MTEVKNTPDKISDKLDMAKEKISELDIAIGGIQSETQRKNRKRESIHCGTTQVA